MRIFLCVFSWYYVVIGLLLCVTPALGKRLANMWMKDKISRAWAVVTIAFGALFFWAAPASRATIFVQTLGGIAVLKGIYLVLAPRAQLTGIVTWWQQVPRRTLRLLGLFTFAIGASILTSL